MIPDELVLAALAWLGTYLVHSTCLLGGVALFARRRAAVDPRLLERMWKLAAFGSLLTATLQTAIVPDPVLGRLSLRELVASDTDGDDDASATDPAKRAGDIPHLALRPEPARTTPTTPRISRPEPAVATPRPRPARRADPHASRGGGLARTPDVTTLPTALPLEAGEPAGAPTPGELEAVPTLAERAVAPAPPPVTASSVAGIATAGEERPPEGETVRDVPWKPALLASWAIVGAWGLLGFLLAWSRLFARLSDRRVLKSGLLVDRLEELCRRAGVRGRVRLSASRSIDSPITHGWFRREICVPERALTELSPAQLESTLAHELAHVLRRDPLWFALMLLVERTLFFQPLNRRARRRLQEIAEVVCDDWAVRWTGRRLALASALTEIAGWIVGRRHLALPSPGMAGSSRLGERVERLLDERLSPAPEPARRWLSPVGLGALGLVVLALPGVSATRARTAPDEEAPTPAPPPPPDAAPATPPETSPAESPLGLRADHELFEGEMELLEEELQELKQELDESQLTDRFEHAFDDIERRLEELRARKERLNALLRRMLAEGDPRPDDNR